MQNNNGDTSTQDSDAQVVAQNGATQATTQYAGQGADQDAAQKQKVEDFAQHIREEVAEAKRTGVKEGSEAAKHIEEEVELIKKEAAKLSPEAFSDLKQHEIAVETIE